MSSSLVHRLRKWLNSPQGRAARRKAERIARDPKTQRKIRQLRGRLRGH